MYKLVISGNTPAQKNNKQILRNRQTGKMFIASNARVKAWQTDALWELKTHRIPKWKYPLSVTMVFYFSDERRRDLENCASSIQDVLVKAGVIEDDDYKHLCPVTLDFSGIDKDNPRCEIFLDEY